MNNKSSFTMQSLFYLVLSILIVVVIFLLLINPKVNLLLKSESKEKNLMSTVILDKEWKYSYAGINTDEEDYPMVCLRSGYKIIKEVGDSVLVGWKYEVLNTTKENHKVNINFKVVDFDKFKIGSGDVTEYVKGESIEEIRGTFLVPISDYERINSSSWTIMVLTDFKDKRYKSNRLIRAGNILKNDSPYWVKQYARFIGSHSSEQLDSLRDNRWIQIADAMGISQDPQLKDLRKKIGLMNLLNMPPWNEIKRKEAYKAMNKEEKGKVKDWLRLEDQYGWYNPEKGTKLNLDDIEPDPFID